MIATMLVGTECAVPFLLLLGVIIWSDVLAGLAKPILGALAGLFGGGDEEMPSPMTPMYPALHDAFGDWIGSSFFQKPEGGHDQWGLQAFPGTARTPYSGSAQGPGVDMIGQMSPDIADTILPRVYSAWQPMDAGTMYLADMLVNKNPVGKDDPRARQVMDWGGFGGPGHDGMVSALQYGVPSDAGRALANISQWGVANNNTGQYMANLAQYGVTSQPMADFMRAATSGGLNPHRKVPIPPRS